MDTSPRGEAGSSWSWSPQSAPALGYALLDPTHGHTGAFAQGFAAAALLAVIAETMLPEAYDVENVSTGSLVAIGFSISLMLSGAI